MTDATELSTLLAQRRQPGASADGIATIDAAIFTRFGRMQAVMFTDLVGFSRVVEAFGIVHFLQLIQEAEALFMPLIAAHGGRCLKHEGDSLLVLFDAPQHAVACAHAMVQATRTANTAQRLPEERIEVCIGLGHGTVLCIDDQDVWGAEVNAASKLGEDTAKGGEIWVTDSLFAAVPDLPFTDTGTLFGKRTVYRLQSA